MRLMSIVAPRFQKQALFRFFTKIPRPLLVHYILANLHQDRWFDREGKLIYIRLSRNEREEFFLYPGCNWKEMGICQLFYLL